MKQAVTPVVILSAVILLTSCAQPQSTGVPSTPTPPSLNLAGLSSGTSDKVTSAKTLTVQPPSASIAPDRGKSVSLEVSDLLIYNKGYYSLDGETWKQFEFDESTVGQSDYILHNANTSIMLSGSDLNEDVQEQILIYSCYWGDTEWNCYGERWQRAFLDYTQQQTCTGDSCAVADMCIEENGIHQGSICVNGEMQDFPDQPSDFSPN